MARDFSSDTGLVNSQNGFGLAATWPATLPVTLIPLDHMPLLDSAHETLRGGSGETFDWSSTAGLSRPFVAAGGLGPDNVGAAIERLRPWGVDASSRLESSPGRKDEQLVRDFVTTAKHGMRPA